MKKHLFLFLSINLLGFCICNSQELQLKVEAESKEKTQFIDSLIYIKKHSSFKSISSELVLLKKKLQYAGYIDLIQKPTKRLSDTLVYAEFNLNKRYDSIKINLINTEFTIQELIPLDKRATVKDINIAIKDIETALNYLNKLQTSKGSPFSFVQLSNLIVKKNKLTSTLISQSAPNRKVDKIVMKGYDDFPTSFIKYGARLKANQPYNNKDVTKRANRLNSLPFANSIKSPEVLFTKDSTTVFLYLEKKKANSFDGFLGFSNSSESGESQFNGYLDLELTNNLNYGESLKLKYKSDGREQLQFKAFLNLPYILKSPVGLLLDLNIFKRDSTFLTVDQSARLNYPITSNASISSGYRASTSTDLRDEITAGSVIEDFQANYFTLSTSILKRNSTSIFPVHYSIDTEILTGKRKTDNTSLNQTKGTVDIQYSLPLNTRNSVYFRNIGTFIISNNYLTNELYRIGGILSIRGFEENSIDTTLSNIIQTEYRYLVSKNLYTHSVIDLGYYENKNAALKENLYSFGFGLGLITNSGLLKVVFANGKNQSQSFKFSNTKVHLSLTATF